MRLGGMRGGGCLGLGGIGSAFGCALSAGGGPCAAGGTGVGPAFDSVAFGGGACDVSDGGVGCGCPGMYGGGAFVGGGCLNGTSACGCPVGISLAPVGAALAGTGVGAVGS